MAIIIKTKCTNVRINPDKIQGRLGDIQGKEITKAIQFITPYLGTLGALRRLFLFKNRAKYITPYWYVLRSNSVDVGCNTYTYKEVAKIIKAYEKLQRSK